MEKLYGVAAKIEGLKRILPPICSYIMSYIASMPIM